MNWNITVRFFCVVAVLVAVGQVNAQTGVKFSHGFTTIDDGGIAFLRNSGNLAIIDQQGGGGGGTTRLDIYTTNGVLVNIVQLPGTNILDDGLTDLPNGNLVVLTDTGDVLEIDPVSGAIVPGGYGGFNVLAALGPGAETSGFAVNPVTLSLWVIDDNGNPFDTLTQFDQDGNVISGPIFALPANLNGDAEAVTLMPGMQTLMVAEDDTNSVMEITPTGELVQNLSVATLSAGSGLFVDPDGLAVDFETDRMFVMNKGDNNGNVMVFDLTVPILLGDINGDGVVNLLDVSPFIDVINSGVFNANADMNQDGVVNLLDVSPFVDALTGN